MTCTGRETYMSLLKLSLALGAILLAPAIPVASQGLLLIPDSAQRALARKLCGSLAEDGLVLDPMWPRAGDLVSQQFNLLELPRLLPTRVVAEYPRNLRERGIQGVVFVAAIIDTTGHIEATSVKVVTTPHDDFLPAVRNYLDQVRFSPGRVHERRVRVCTAIQVPFLIRTR